MMTNEQTFPSAVRASYFNDNFSERLIWSIRKKMDCGDGVSDIDEDDDDDDDNDDVDVDDDADIHTLCTNTSKMSQ